MTLCKHWCSRMQPRQQSCSCPVAAGPSRAPVKLCSQQTRSGAADSLRYRSQPRYRSWQAEERPFAEEPGAGTQWCPCSAYAVSHNVHQPPPPANIRGAAARTRSRGAPGAPLTRRSGGIMKKGTEKKAPQEGFQVHGDVACKRWLLDAPCCNIQPPKRTEINT